MMRKIAVLTTFSLDGWNQYAKRMVTSWVKHWPIEVTLHLYPDSPVIAPDAPNVRQHTVLNHPKLEFIGWAKDQPAMQGYHPNKPEKYDYRYDGIKFSHKPFALHHFVHNLAEHYDALIWLDADTLTHRDVPYKTVCEMIAPTDVDVTFLGRSYKYTECGFIHFNLNGTGPRLIDKWVEFYTKRTLLREKEWHDSYLFDRARDRLRGKLRERDLTSHLHRRKGAGHPMINSFLGGYLDHHKGNARKMTGKPRHNDLYIEQPDAPYWNEENPHARVKKHPA